MLWIALHLPRLSLESFVAALPDDLRRRPIVLVEAGRIVAVDAGAQAAGVQPGMKRATALGLAPQLVVAAADARRDAQALQAVLHASLAFTPAVAALPPCEALLEVQASLRCFGGPQALLRRLRAALAPLGHELRIAVAPTAQGAALLARAAPGEPVCCADRAELRRALAALPLALLDAGRAHADALQGMGLRSVADLARVPRAGLARRFGEALHDELDRALGLRPDPRAWVALPPAFESRLELFARAETAAQVLHGAGVLLARLVAWLAAQQALARRFTLAMAHESGRAGRLPASAVAIELAAPSRELAHLALLLRERLARTTLAAPALELALRCDEIVHAAPPNGELFASAQGEREGLMRLVERLQARLGRQQVLRLRRLRDHRPERGAALEAADAAALPARAQAARTGGATEAARARGAAEPRLRSADDASETALARGAAAPITRPVWLVEPPQPLPADRREQPLLGGAALQLLSGPERIETGWWDDDGLAERDYFIAQAADASLVWIYRQRLPDLASSAGGWFLHGRFG